MIPIDLASEVAVYDGLAANVGLVTANSTFRAALATVALESEFDLVKNPQLRWSLAVCPKCGSLAAKQLTQPSGRDLFVARGQQPGSCSVTHCTHLYLWAHLVAVCE